MVEREIYPHSQHLELPGRLPSNSWQQAFLWVRDNTPQDALFALDFHYIVQPGEDTQNFRAIAQRSSLADYSKDGGSAANRPVLAPQWVRDQAAQDHLNQIDDATRVVRLRPLGVDWMILDRSAKTMFACPYANTAVKICRLP